MRAMFILGAVILGSSWASLGYADQLYTDRAAFLAAIVDEVVIDFEAEPLGAVVGDPWLADGIVFDEAGVGDNMTIGGGGGADKNIYAPSSRDADIDITFPNPVLAFGLGVFSNDVQSPGERIIFHGTGGAVLKNVEMPLMPSQGTEFVGYIADAQTIVKVEFIEGNGDGDWAGVGDVAFMVPEPATLALLALGGLALIRKKAQPSR